MYSTQFEDELRYVVTCIANQTSVRLIETIVDTGAKYTCYQVALIDDTLQEKDMLDQQILDIGGFVDGDERKNTVRFYKYPVKQFTIGSIDVGAREVWITFDRRVKDNVLGLDILQSVCFLQLDNSRELLFFKNRAELKEYVSRTMDQI